MYLGLGSNVGDRAANLRAALTAIALIGSIDATSAVYETEPVGFAAQRAFWNMALRMRTHTTPEQLLHELKRLESVLGREPTFRMGPRSIDIDLLLYGDISVATPSLTVPHPALMDRAFVLRPLLDLDPALRHPVTGMALAERVQELSPGGLVRLGTTHDLVTGTLADA